MNSPEHMMDLQDGGHFYELPRHRPRMYEEYERHNTLMQKMAQLPMPDFAYNWVASFLLDRKHMIKFEQTLSSVLSIYASIIQGSVIGPTVYVINASDLKANANDPSN